MMTNNRRHLGSLAIGTLVLLLSTLSIAWPAQAAEENPIIAGKCGLTVAVVMDLSGSVSGHQHELKAAVDAMIDGLQGTPSSVALFTFSTASPSPNTQNYPIPKPVTTAAQATDVKNLYAGWTPSGNTSWAAGLTEAVKGNAINHYDVVFLITDAAPNNSSATYAQADLLKQAGTRVVAVAIGNFNNNTTGFESVAGPEAYNPTEENYTTADYFVLNQYAQVGTALHKLATTNCTGTVNVITEIAQGPDPVVDGTIPSGDWTVTVAVRPTGTTTALETIGTAATATDGTGAVSFGLAAYHTANPAVTAVDIVVTEEAQSGYTLFPVNGQNGVCRSLVTNTPLPVTSTGQTNGFTITDVPITEAVSCTFVNVPGSWTTLTLASKVVGPPIPDDWTWTLSATSTTANRGISDRAGGNGVKSQAVTPDVYTLSSILASTDPAVPSSYVQTGWECVDGANPPNPLTLDVDPNTSEVKVTVVAGTSVTCTVTITTLSNTGTGMDIRTGLGFGSVGGLLLLLGGVLFVSRYGLIRRLS